MSDSEYNLTTKGQFHIPIFPKIARLANLSHANSSTLRHNLGQFLHSKLLHLQLGGSSRCCPQSYKLHHQHHARWDIVEVDLTTETSQKNRHSSQRWSHRKRATKITRMRIKPAYYFRTTSVLFRISDWMLKLPIELSVHSILWISGWLSMSLEIGVS